MSEKTRTNNSESLLHTDIMKPIGVKGSSRETLMPPTEYLESFGNGGDKRPELVNQEVDEILNDPPNWLLRWGTTLFFSVLLLIMTVTWFIKYPDVVSASLQVMPGRLPKSIVSRSNGSLKKLFVKDNQQVKEDDILAFIESTADHNDVLKLEQLIDELIQKENDIESIYKIEIPLYFNLGDLQKSYQSFQEAYIRSKSALKSGTFSKKKGTISGEISSLRSLRSSTYEQLALQERDLQMALDEAEARQRLADKGYVSALDARNAMRNYLNKKQLLEQAKSSLENNTISQSQKRHELLEMDKTIEEHSINLIQTIYSLKSDIESWKQRYITVASTSGIVHFTSTLQENKQLQAGDEIMLIAPESEEYQGEMWVGQYNFGKVKLGQEVIIKFDSYPFQEFGTVKGKISYIGDIPKDSTTLVNVTFPEGLVTNLHKSLPYRFGMKANAEIITEDMRLIERFFYDIRKMLKK